MLRHVSPLPRPVQVLYRPMLASTSMLDLRRPQLVVSSLGPRVKGPSASERPMTPIRAVPNPAPWLLQPELLGPVPKRPLTPSQGYRLVQADRRAQRPASTERPVVTQLPPTPSMQCRIVTSSTATIAEENISPSRSRSTIASPVLANRPILIFSPKTQTRNTIGSPVLTHRQILTAPTMKQKTAPAAWMSTPSTTDGSTPLQAQGFQSSHREDEEEDTAMMRSPGSQDQMSIGRESTPARYSIHSARLAEPWQEQKEMKQKMDQMQEQLAEALVQLQVLTKRFTPSSTEAEDGNRWQTNNEDEVTSRLRHCLAQEKLEKQLMQELMQHRIDELERRQRLSGASTAHAGPAFSRPAVPSGSGNTTAPAAA